MCIKHRTFSLVVDHSCKELVSVFLIQVLRLTFELFMFDTDAPQGGLNTHIHGSNI